MKRLAWLAVVLAVVLSGSTVWAAGDFYVIAGGGRPVGTKITSLPCTITQPGFYFFTGNLTYSDPYTNAIMVYADNVTLDLMGFSLTYKGGGNVVGVDLSDQHNVEVRNGSIIGFWRGVDGTGFNYRIINIRANNGIIPNSFGIALGGGNHLVQGCSACNNSAQGIFVVSGMVKNCNASNNTGNGIGISSGSVIGNMANGNSIGFNLGGDNIVVDCNTANGNTTSNYQDGPSNPAYWGINAGR